MEEKEKVGKLEQGRRLAKAGPGSTILISLLDNAEVYRFVVV